MRENTLSPRKVFFATYTPNGSPLGGRRREKWIKPYSRPAGRELCEAFLTVSAAGNPAAVLFFVDIFLLGRYNNVLGRNTVKTLKIKD